MIKIENPLVAVPVKFGMLGGAVSFLIFLITYLSGRNPLIDLTFVDFFLLPVFLFFGMKEFRDFRNNGISHFWQGMTVGVITYLTIAVLSAIFILIFLSFIAPELVDQYVADRLEMFNLKKDDMIKQLGEDSYNINRAEVSGTTAWILALDDFLKKCIIGLTLTFPLSVILRRREL